METEKKMLTQEFQFFTNMPSLEGQKPQQEDESSWFPYNWLDCQNPQTDNPDAL